MPTIVYRQPWFWGVFLAVLAVLLVGIVIMATPPESREVVTVIAPAPGVTPPATSPAPAPSAPDRDTVVVEKPVPGPTVVEKQPVIVEKPVPVPVPAEGDRDRAAGGAAPPSVLYEDTRLPKQIAYDSRVWQAKEQMAGLETDLLLTRSEDRINGKPVYHERLDEKPYDRVYLKVEGRDDRFVVYEPAEP